MNTKPNISVKSKQKYHQGTFKPLHSEKYIGDPTKIIYRSKWELLFLRWADTNSSVIRYASEECIIPYISPIDNKQHRYFMDFYIEVLQSSGNIKKFLVEVKPFAQTKTPKVPKQGVLCESYQNACKTYLINQAKWNAARKLCMNKGWEFIIITEKELFKSRGTSHVRKRTNKRHKST